MPTVMILSRERSVCPGDPNKLLVFAKLARPALFSGSRKRIKITNAKPIIAPGSFKKTTESFKKNSCINLIVLKNCRTFIMINLQAQIFL